MTAPAIDPELAAVTLPCASCGAVYATMHAPSCQRWEFVPAGIRPGPDHYQCGTCRECLLDAHYRCQECACEDCRDWRDDCAADWAAEAKSEMERGR